MNTHDKVIQWAKALEYKGNIPNSFKSLCIPSTMFIWEQLVAQVKPKQEVQQLRRKNLIVRLQNKQNIEDWNKIHRSIKELELWRRKCKLQEEIKEISESIEEKEKQADNYSKEHKIRGMKRANVKALIKENEAKTFLLRKKLEALQNEISDVEENLIFFRNLTPIESSEEPDIGDTLRKCVEKIEKSISDQKMQAPACLKNNLSVTPRKVSFTNIFTQSDTSLETYSKCEEYKNNISEEINCLHDENISKAVKSLLYNTDTRSILNVVLNDIEILKMKLFNTITSTKPVAGPGKEDNQMFGIMKLQTMQIENELYALKYTKQIEKLKILLRKKETEITTAFNELNQSDRRELFLFQRKEAGLNAVCTYINTKLANNRTVKDAKEELERIDVTILTMQQKLVDALRNVNHKYELYKKMYKTMLSYREETRILMKKLNQFTNDLTWTLPLTYDLFSKEVLLFKEFPLEYNRRITIGDSNVYTRDIINIPPIDVENIDMETLQMLLILIENPYSAPERLFYRLWEKKVRIKVRESLYATVKSFDYKTYTLEELQEQESYIDTTIAKLHGLMRMYNGKTSDRDPKMIREIARLWLEIPFSNYIRQDRLYEGKNIMYYQNMCDNFYNQISK